jgi:SAM-dependent methyltransferase
MEINEFFFEMFHPSLMRHGPGSDRETERALALLQPLLPAIDGRPLRVIDIGCGTGPQTLALARSLDCIITAVDIYQPFLDEMMRRAAKAGVAEKIKPVCRDMAELRAADGPFDLLWSEGALFAMGVIKGMSSCRDLLRPGGCLAVTDLCWWSADPPAPCREFFGACYPEMPGEDAILAAIREAGLAEVNHFRLPDSAWTDNYFGPMEKRLKELEKQYGRDSEQMKAIAEVRAESDIFGKYSAHYGYDFFLARRP